MNLFAELQNDIYYNQSDFYNIILQFDFHIYEAND